MPTPVCHGRILYRVRTSFFFLHVFFFRLSSSDAKITESTMLRWSVFEIGVFAMDWVQKVDIAGLIECRYLKKKKSNNKSTRIQHETGLCLVCPWDEKKNERKETSRNVHVSPIQSPNKTRRLFFFFLQKKRTFISGRELKRHFLEQFAQEFQFVKCK